jgi:hypothetical protein
VGWGVWWVLGVVVVEGGVLWLLWMGGCCGCVVGVVVVRGYSIGWLVVFFVLYIYR